MKNKAITAFNILNEQPLVTVNTKYANANSYKFSAFLVMTQ